VAAITEITKELNSLTVFISELTACANEVLRIPVSGTWSVQDIISHIMGWDKSFSKTLHQIIHDEEVRIEEDHDVQGFNESSVAYGRSMSPQDLLKEALFHRKQLIQKVSLVNESVFVKQFHNSTYTLEAFLQKMFIEHDKHHVEQIRRYLKNGPL
jgi:hypothetical protein